MPEDLITNLPDATERDILIRIAGGMNTLNRNVEKVCVDVARHEHQLTVLQTQHDSRTASGVCPVPETAKQSGSLVVLLKQMVGGGVGAAFILLALLVLKSMGFTF